MSTANHNLSSYNPDKVPSASGYRFAIITSEWNNEITGKLNEGAYSALLNCGAEKQNIEQYMVPGSFELTAAAAMIASKNIYDAIICLGCVIQGETRHFDFICSAVANGLSNISIHHNIPVIFGVLTTDTQMQAADRSGGKYGNKGTEAAITAVKMADLAKKLKSKK
jgi:6,7-dimethyl-8-ribityllumazine synthase